MDSANQNSKSLIENDIKRLKYGLVGENNIYYELKNSFMPMVCLHYIRIESLIVIANPKTVIDKKYAPKDIKDKIIRHDQLIDYISNIENNKKIEWVFIEEDMMNISNCLKQHHKELNIDYKTKYSLDNEVNIKEMIIEKEAQINETIKSKTEDDIRNDLKEYRLSKSKEEKIKAYMVFNNETMDELITNKPKNLKELENIKGFGPVKIQKYGEDLINIIGE